MPLQWDLAYKRKTSLDWLNLSSQSWVWFWIFFSGIYSPDEKCRRKYHIFTTLRLEIFIMVSNGTIKNWVSKCQYNEWLTVTLTLSVCETETDSVSQWLTDWVVSECDFELQLVTLSLTSYSSLLTCDCECVTHTHLVSDSQCECHYSLFTKSKLPSKSVATSQWHTHWQSRHSEWVSERAITVEVTATMTITDLRTWVVSVTVRSIDIVSVWIAVLVALCLSICYCCQLCVALLM